MASTSDTSSGFGRGALQLAASNAVYVVAAYLTTTLIARELDPSEFAGFGVVMAWITVLTALLVKGLATSCAREMASGEDDEDSGATAWRAGLSLGIWLSLGLAIVGAACAPLIARLTDAPDLTAQLAIGALGALTFGTNAVLLAWPTGRRRYGRQALAQVAYGLARLALVLGGGIAFGLNGAVVGYVLAPLVSSLSLLTRIPRSRSREAFIASRRAMLRMIGPVALVSIAITAYFVVDVFGLAAAIGGDSEQVGTYVAYGTLAHVPFFLLQATSVAMVPAIVAARSAVLRATAIRRTMTDTIVLLAGPTLLLVTAGDAAARVVFGSEYHVNGLVVAPLAIGTAAVTWMAGLVAVDVALDRLRGAMVLSALGVILVTAAARLAPEIMDDTDPASAAAWLVAAACVLTTIALALRGWLRFGRFVEASRALRGLGLGVLTALPPLLVSDEGARMALAAICGIVWLALVLRLRIVDVRRAAPDADDTAMSAGM